MYFAASKIFWALAAPSHIIACCAMVAAVLLLAGRRRAGTGFAVASALLLLGLGVAPSYIWLGQGLENRFDRVPLPAHADGIIVLGGGYYDLLRLPPVAILSRHYPDAKVVFSGGSGELINNTPDVEAQQSKQYLIALGVDPRRIVTEGRSRNTFENLTFTRALIKPQASQVWILMTSAYHMPRAMAIAQRIGWTTLVPRQTDRLTPCHTFYGWFNVSTNLQSFDMITRERIGLLTYGLSRGG